MDKPYKPNPTQTGRVVTASFMEIPGSLRSARAAVSERKPIQSLFEPKIDMRSVL